MSGSCPRSMTEAKNIVKSEGYADTWGWSGSRDHGFCKVLGYQFQSIK